MTAITLTGDNSYLIFTELRRLEENFRNENDAIGIERIDAGEMEAADFLHHLQSVPLLSSKRFLAVRGFSRNKYLSEKVEQIISSLDEGTDLVILEPNPDKRTRSYKALHQLTDWHEYTVLDERKLVGWIVEYVEADGGRINRTDAAYIVTRLTADQQLLKNELDKLLNYQAEITRQTIDLLTEPSPQSNVFDLLDAAFSSSARRTILLYRELRQQNVEPLSILAMIGWQLCVLALVSAAGTRDAGSISREAGLNPFVIRKSQRVLQALSRERVERLLRQTMKTEYELKTQSIDADEAIIQLLIEIALT